MHRHARKPRRERGFTILEAVATILVLTLTTLSLTKLIGRTQKTAGAVQSVTVLNFFEDLLNDRLSVVLQNVLYWIGNVSWSCEHTGYYLHGTLTRAVQPTKGGIPAISAGVVRSQFLDPLRVNTPEGLTQLTLIEKSNTSGSTAPAGSGPAFQAMLDWWAWYKGVRGNAGLPTITTQVGEALARCLQNDLLPNSTLNGTAASNGRYEFCLLLDSNVLPTRRTELANNRETSRFTRGFQFAHVDAQLFDTIRNENIVCVSKNINSQAIIGERIARSFVVSTRLYAVTESNQTARPELQKLTVALPRDYMVQKEPRPVVNCNQCDYHASEPTWLYECVVPARCRCYCRFNDVTKQYYIDPSAQGVFPECWDPGQLAGYSVQQLCEPGARYNF